ncbi:glycosyltransferase family 4 protein [Polynucleobacter paneuropaeus]|nr:glycosyltransferase family 4 protein [Polynucleobacter paneuropaeus]
MNIGINAINIRAGGGITHLTSLLSHANPKLHGFKKIVVWGNSRVLGKIEDRPWLIKVLPTAADKSLFRRVLWQVFKLKNSLHEHECNILFSPGGSDFSRFSPVVGMSQNMLPFEMSELIRYGFSLSALKFMLLRLIQSHHLKNADGVIFLTNYAKNSIMKIVQIQGLIKIIPHGINPIFQGKVVRNLVKDPSIERLKVLYISNVEYYKHQWNVVEAVARLRMKGLQVDLDLIGAPMRGVPRLNKALNQFDPSGRYIQFHGEMPQMQLSGALNGADIFIFASSCENLPITLLEAMASGVPIASSNMGPMPEVLGNAGVYFNPLDVGSISNSIMELCNTKKLRADLSRKAIARSNVYKWSVCAKETFLFLSEVKQAYQGKSK